jgi:aryl-alcohol dehydrogenase-like predicted oxidoreductase
MATIDDKPDAKAYNEETVRVMSAMSKVFPPPPPPTTALGYYRMLAPTASVRVSPICLGTMNFGNSWEGYMGECSKETTFEILDYFYNNGGNFIDTANNYQREEAEIWIGEWMKARGNRDQIVLATKYTTCYRAGYGDKEIIANTVGNGTKSMHTSIESSLKKLGTSYIDLFYVHWWDYATSIPEIMHSLNSLVVSGKVLYLGISDTPAWIVAKANQYARDHGLRQFSVYQGKWSAEYRDFERDIIPMCKDEGMGLAPWGVLGSGSFKSAAQRSKTDGRQNPITEEQVKISDTLESIAERKGSTITGIAQAYVMHKTPYVFPIIGGRKLEHLKANVEALKVVLSKEDIAEIEGAKPFDLGFPMNQFGQAASALWITKMAGEFDYVEGWLPIVGRR